MPNPALLQAYLDALTADAGPDGHPSAQAQQHAQAILEGDEEGVEGEPLPPELSDSALQAILDALLSGDKERPTARAKHHAAAIAEMLQDPEAVHALLEEQASMQEQEAEEEVSRQAKHLVAAMEKYVQEQPERYTAHAPKGGIEIKGKSFSGGEFIPGEYEEHATEEQKKELVHRDSDGKEVDKSPEKDTAEGDYAARFPDLGEEYHAAMKEVRVQEEFAKSLRRRAKAPETSYAEVGTLLNQAGTASAQARAAWEKNIAKAHKALYAVARAKKFARIAVDVQHSFPEGTREQIEKATVFLDSFLEESQWGKLPVTIEKVVTGRASYNPRDNIINITPHTYAETVIHEFGHQLENHSPEVKKAIADWSAKRFGDEDEISLSDAFPKMGFGKDERGRKDALDKLFHAAPHSAYYTGKQYKTAGSEVLSMGIELLYQDPAWFAKTDPDYFNLVVGILHGKHLGAT